MKQANKHNLFSEEAIAKYNFKHLRRWSISLFAVILFVSGVFALSAMAHTSPKKQFQANNDLVSLANKERISHNLMPLKSNPQLERAAFAKARDMLKNQYFEHVSPSGLTPWQFISESGYNYDYAGENLAVDFIDSTSTHRAWMKSPTHRANILEPNYREVGIVSISGQMNGRDTIITVEMFGSKQNASIVQRAKSLW